MLFLPKGQASLEHEPFWLRSNALPWKADGLSQVSEWVFLSDWDPWTLRCIFILAFTLALHAVTALYKHRRIRQLGSRTTKFPTRLPLGLDLIAKSLPLPWHSKSPSLRLWDEFLKATPECSRTVEVNVGGQQTILTADARNIKAVLATQFSSYGKGAKFNVDWHEFLGNGIFSTDGHIWQQGRAVVRAVLAKDRLSDIDVFERHTTQLLPLLTSKEAVDVRPLLFGFTLDIATGFLLEASTDSIHDPANEFAAAFSYIQKFHARLARMGFVNKVLPRGQLRRQLKVFNAFLEPFVDQALKLSPGELEDKPDTFLHALAAQTRDRKMIRDQITSVLLAGRDTTACTLSWLLYELAFAPQIVEALRREIMAVVGMNRAPGFAELKSMRLLQHAINETLRLYPAVPLNVREALEDTSLPFGGGTAGDEPIGVLKGTPVFYSTHFMQLSEGNYPQPGEKGADGISDPAVFDPWRWDSWRPEHHTYIPFNAGPRLCAGQQLALTEMGYAIVRILQRYTRLEPKGDLLRRNPRKPGSRRSDSLPARVSSARVKMKNEVVLQPAEPITIAFHTA